MASDQRTPKDRTTHSRAPGNHPELLEGVLRREDVRSVASDLEVQLISGGCTASATQTFETREAQSDPLRPATR
jgi:hypothetical protein